MKKLISTILFCSLIFSGMQAQETSARIILPDVTLMHEMRATPFPLDKATVSDRIVSFQWPLQADVNTSENILDGMKSTQVAFEIPAAVFTRCGDEKQGSANGKPLAFFQS